MSFDAYGSADVEFVPIGLVRVTTESSIWLVTEGCYRRMPRTERVRRLTITQSRRLTDLVEHPWRRCWWRTDIAGDQRLRILPVAGDPDGVGVVSGVIVDVRGSWTCPR